MIHSVDDIPLTKVKTSNRSVLCHIHDTRKATGPHIWATVPGRCCLKITEHFFRGWSIKLSFQTEIQSQILAWSAIQLHFTANKYCMRHFLSLQLSVNGSTIWTGVKMWETNVVVLCCWWRAEPSEQSVWWTHGNVMSSVNTQVWWWTGSFSSAPPL